MKLHELRPPAGAKAGRRRVGRGHGSGRGKTAGRGTKGQSARSGRGVPQWFEGGQVPLTMRFPHKKGFKPLTRVEYQLVNLWQLARAFPGGGAVGPDELVAAGLVDPNTKKRPIKILAAGQLEQALTVQAHKFSAAARQAIESAGGSAVELPA